MQGRSFPNPRVVFLESAARKEPGSELREIRSSEEWCRYFARNDRNLRVIQWELGADAPRRQIARIVPSLRGWQLGETSEGRHLMRVAAKYAESMNDPAFVDATGYFIREEQRHGETLGRFLDLAGVPRARFNWGDGLFRFARYFLANMEVWATPVVMVETHAMVYYHALSRATSSRVLRTICQQILCDEVPHIRFQCERLAALHRGRSAMLMGLTRLGHRVFFTLITLAVWVGHRRALRAGGYDFYDFWRSVWRRMRHNWKMMSPKAYH
jgi:hypothetical protein